MTKDATAEPGKVAPHEEEQLDRVLCKSEDGLPPDEDFLILINLPVGRRCWPAVDMPDRHKIMALRFQRDGRYMLIFHSSSCSGYAWSKYEADSMEVTPEAAEAIQNWFAAKQKTAE